MRDGLPRAYLRMSPNLDQHPDPLGMVMLMCAAARQPERGRFKDRRVLERVVGRKRLTEMRARADVVAVAGGYYVEGWDEWQEGDMTVSERMRRLRARRASRKRDPVTEPASPARTDVTTDAVVDDSIGSLQGVDVDVESPPPPAERGRRKNGTNPRSVQESPRQTGTNPRANGASPRQEREAQKREPVSVGHIFRGMAAVAESEE
jgi:hypothetical protein